MRQVLRSNCNDFKTLPPPFSLLFTQVTPVPSLVVPSTALSPQPPMDTTKAFNPSHHGARFSFQRKTIPPHEVCHCTYMPRQDLLALAIIFALRILLAIVLLFVPSNRKVYFV